MAGSPPGNHQPIREKTGARLQESARPLVLKLVDYRLARQAMAGMFSPFIQPDQHRRGDRRDLEGLGEAVST